MPGLRGPALMLSTPLDALSLGQGLDLGHLTPVAEWPSREASPAGPSEWGVSVSPSKAPSDLWCPWGTEPTAPRGSAWPANTDGWTLDRDLSAKAPGCWLLQAPEPFAPQPTSFSP